MSTCAFVLTLTPGLLVMAFGVGWLKGEVVGRRRAQQEKGR